MLARKYAIESIRKQESVLAKTMTTKELAKYLRVHEITICKHAATGEIPGKRVGKIWRFEKNTIDTWIRTGGRTIPQTSMKLQTIRGSQTLKKRTARKQETKGQ
jgi:excisionase family DNA binding protein